MSILFVAYILALFLSLFVVGAILGAVLTKPDTQGQTPIMRAKRRLRALVFGWEFPPFNSGGLGVACLGIIRSLSKQDVDVTFVLPKRFPISVSYAKVLAAELEDIGASIHYVDSGVQPYASAGSYAVGPDGLPLYGDDLMSQTRRYALAGAQIAKREPHDVIYAHDWLSFGAGTAAKRVSGKPLIAHLHASEFARTGGRGVNQHVYDLERDGMHKADRVITVSHRTKDAVEEHYAVPNEKIRVVWNGIDDDTAPAQDLSASPRLSVFKKAGHKIVLFAGRLTIQKGPDHFLNAAKIVAGTDPDALFIMAGAGDMERQLVRQAAVLGIADRVLFPGFLRDHDMHEAYASADVFVMPSVSEPFGIAALEAMRVGTPVILSSQSGVAEAVPDALSADFWDAPELAKLIHQVLNDPALRARLSESGREAATRLSWDRAGISVRGVMDEVAPISSL